MHVRPWKIFVMDSCSMTETPSLWSIISDDTSLSAICLFLPSLTIRLPRFNRAFAEFFDDPKLADLLPQTFEKLGLFYSNPFAHCHKGDIESMWLMLVHGVDPFIVDQVCFTYPSFPTLQNGETLLQGAVQSGNRALVHMLIERGCSVSAKGMYGYSALHQVAYTPWASLCEFILQNGGNTDALSKNGSTPLLIAAREGHPAVVEMMLRYGADPNDGGDKGLTPLLLASAEGHLEIVKLLLSFKADANLALYEGRSALHEASEAGQADVCRALVSLGNACVNCEDSEGMTPLSIGENLGRDDIVDILKKTKYTGAIVYREADKKRAVSARQTRLPPEIAFSN